MNTAQEQFIEDYTLVIDNEQTAYLQHMHLVKTRHVADVAEQLQEYFEGLVSQIVDLARANKMNNGADLIAQMLIGYGADTFYKIARHYQEMVGE